MTPDEQSSADRWLQWLTHGRDAGSAELRQETVAHLAPIRDRVLDGAHVLPGETVLDVGTGEGLLGIAALDRVGAGGDVIFSDASEAALDALRHVAQELSFADHVTFVPAVAEDLRTIATMSVDAVVLRSVLIYVQRRDAALRAFARVLRPGGRLSLFEPLNGVFRADGDQGFFGWDIGDAAELAAPVRAVFEQAQPPDRDPMLTLRAEELVRHAEAAGFGSIRAQVELVNRAPGPAMETPVERLLHGQGNPAIPSISDAARRALPLQDAERFLDALVGAVREGRGRLRQAHVYFTAELPA